MDELFEKRKKIIYEFICDEFYVPMKLKELSMLLQVPKDQKGELKAVMDSLEKEGKVHVTQKGKYIKGEAKQLRGMFQANARGFGFVTVEGESEDIFISEDDMNGAMQGDEVEVVITKAPEGMRREGKITKIAQGVIDGDSHYYIMLEGSDEIFDVSVVDFIEIIKYNVGDDVKLEYAKGDKANTVLSLK